MTRFPAVRTAFDGACDDGDACTEDDACLRSVVLESSRMRRRESCTEDSCDPALGCLAVSVEGPCDDGDACTVGDLCVNGMHPWSRTTGKLR